MIASFNKYFRTPVLISILGFCLAAYLAKQTGLVAGGLANALFVVLILTVLEVSISFDNAVVNASVLTQMTPLWQRRFLTWGILIAVFGMRLVFPLAIVSVIGDIGPAIALKMAIDSPHQYAELMHSIHHEVSAFGGAFLLMVAMKYFFDEEKDSHWIGPIERPLVKLGRLESIEIGIGISCLLFLSGWVEPAHSKSVLIFGLAGVLVYIFVEALETFLEYASQSGHGQAGGKADSNGLKIVNQGFVSAQFGSFVYLEVLDASFSFDGVVGAFAITNNLFLILIGLGIGALFVRSLTLMLVERQTLKTFPYLEHGAFYAVTSLAAIMLLNTKYDISEWITGGIGAVFIGTSMFSGFRGKATAT